MYEAHHTLGGRARTEEGPYRTNEGPHALYSGGPHWTWLGQRDLIGPLAPLPPLEAARLRLHHKGALRRTPPFAMLKLLRPRRTGQQAPVDVDFLTWATEQADEEAGEEAGEEAAHSATHYSAVALFHHHLGSLSAVFVQERLCRATKLPRGDPRTAVRARSTCPAPAGATALHRPAVDRGDGVYLAGDQVAAPGVLSEVSFNSALAAVSLTPGRRSRNTLDLKHA